MTELSPNTVIVVCGPTASGKSALAMDIAEEFGGVVINADSMQIYRELRILTARPSEADEARVPHRLYGVLSVAETCSAGRWLSVAVPEITQAWDNGLVPIVCGGTGLYIRALMQGLSAMPDIPAATRQAARDAMAEMGNEAFHAMLADVDPDAADRLHVSDTQRLIRAYEVFLATGRSIVDWQTGEAPSPPLEARFHVFAVLPDRETLYAACETRAEAMIEAGALEEVTALMPLGLDPDLPAMKALGVPELMRHLKGELSREEAVAALKRATRNYAKRQITWIRHQIEPDQTLSAQYSERFREKIFSKI